jgi:hypothetical protein
MPYFRIQARRVLGLKQKSNAGPFSPSIRQTAFLEQVEDVVVFQQVRAFTSCPVF